MLALFQGEQKAMMPLPEAQLRVCPVGAGAVALAAAHAADTP